jgi:hypothetical protein
MQQSQTYIICNKHVIVSQIQIFSKIPIGSRDTSKYTQNILNYILSATKLIKFVANMCSFPDMNFEENPYNRT